MFARKTLSANVTSYYSLCGNKVINFLYKPLYEGKEIFQKLVTRRWTERDRNIACDTSKLSLTHFPFQSVHQNSSSTYLTNLTFNSILCNELVQQHSAFWCVCLWYGDLIINKSLATLESSRSILVTECKWSCSCNF